MVLMGFAPLLVMKEITWQLAVIKKISQTLNMEGEFRGNLDITLTGCIDV